MENRTNLKRMIVIIVYLIIFSTIALVIYLIKSPDQSCSDGKQNQAEKGIDCGGPCSPCREISETKDLLVQEVAFLAAENNSYDVIAKVNNPNENVGSSNFNYSFTLKDENGSVIASAEGNTFILPADTKYVAKIGLITTNGAFPKNVEFSIKDIGWETLEGILKPQIGVYEKSFGIDPAGVGNKAEGLLRNESIYDLKRIEVTIVLRDERGKIVGINKTLRESVRAKEQQDFQVTWSKPILENVEKIEMDPQINVFNLKNLSI